MICTSHLFYIFTLHVTTNKAFSFSFSIKIRIINSPIFIWYSCAYIILTWFRENYPSPETWCYLSHPKSSFWASSIIYLFLHYKYYVIKFLSIGHLDTQCWEWLGKSVKILYVGVFHRQPIYKIFRLTTSLLGEMTKCWKFLAFPFHFWQNTKINT